MGVQPKSIEELKSKLLGLSQHDGDCRVWVAGVDSKGYGLLLYEDRQQPAHRLAYRAFIGPIPTGQFVCHTCDNPPCINPDHLFVGTAADNNHDKIAKLRSIFILTEQDAGEIKWFLSLGKYTQGQIAEWYGVSRHTVNAINKGRCWVRITPVRPSEAFILSRDKSYAHVVTEKLAKIIAAIPKRGEREQALWAEANERRA